MLDANGGLFETVLGEQDAIISDALNHASIIDGVRLCKARRLRYANRNLTELEQHLRDTQDSRTRLIATDGVFSMDGSIAPLREICELAEKYGALVMVDDSHATGFMGAGGRGTPEHCGVGRRIDFLTGTFGKALGGGSGGYTSGRRAPSPVAPAFPPVPVFQQHPAVGRGGHAARARSGGEHAGTARHVVRTRAQVPRWDAFRRLQTTARRTSIIPVMIGDAALAASFADQLLGEGVYVIGFSFPVVPRWRSPHPHADVRGTHRRAA